MTNRDLWNYYMETRTSRENPRNPPPSSPPYENLIVIEAQPVISIQPTQRSQYRTPQIPGPGKPIQLGLFRKRAHDAIVSRGESSQSRPTQDFIREAINEPLAADMDFNSPRWTSTIEYLIREGSYNNRTMPFWTGIADIQARRSEFKKVKKVFDLYLIVAMISTLTPNHLGDLLVTLKDPSGKIEGTMHHNIFINDEYRLATAVGAVVILHNVTVSRFTMAPIYLNIVARNVVKIIGVHSMIAEYEPPEQPNIEEEDEDTSNYEVETVPDSESED